MLRRRRYQAESAGIGMFTAAVIFLGMWVVVGKIAEVRIFLPFALALAPLTAELAMQRFLPGAGSETPDVVRVAATLPHS
jgi:hypothetical protein